MTYDFHVTGHPATQGSKKAFKRGKKVVLVEMDPKLPAWRQAVKDAAEVTRGALDPLDGALTVIVDFFMPAPAKSKFGDKPAGPPDLDKLQRAVGDALTASGIIADDARIVRWVAQKHWALDEPGAHIRIAPASSAMD